MAERLASDELELELTSGDIDSAASKITVQGTRYPEHLEQMSGR
jgi:hypothetical protein